MLATLALIPAATALSIGIEFTQLFFPQRTVSQNDIFAEALGGFIGVLAWWGAGGRFVDWLQSWQHTHARAALAERLAWAYLAGVLVYNVLPLDLTISLVEIFHKWQDGKVNLIPFGRLPGDAAYALYEIATDALIWVPLALLWRLDGTRSAWRAWSMALATAVALEIMQLFVFSRVSDVTDLFTAAAAPPWGASPAAGWPRAKRPSASRCRRAPRPPCGQGGGMAPFALSADCRPAAVRVLVSFDFRTDGAFIKSRLDFVHRVRSRCYIAPNTVPSPKCCARRCSFPRSAVCWRGAWRGSRGVGAVPSLPGMLCGGMRPSSNGAGSCRTKSSIPRLVLAGWGLAATACAPQAARTALAVPHERPSTRPPFFRMRHRVPLAIAAVLEV